MCCVDRAQLEAPQQDPPFGAAREHISASNDSVVHSETPLGGVCLHWGWTEGCECGPGAEQDDDQDGKGEDTSVEVSQGLRQAPLLLHARYLLQEALDLCGFNLTEPEAAAVEERGSPVTMYCSHKDPSYVDYKFLNEMEAYFTVPGMEKMTTVDPQPYAPTLLVDTNTLLPEEEHILERTLHRIAERFDASWDSSEVDYLN